MCSVSTATITWARTLDAVTVTPYSIRFIPGVLKDLGPAGDVALMGDQWVCGMALMGQAATPQHVRSAVSFPRKRALRPLPHDRLADVA